MKNIRKKKKFTAAGRRVRLSCTGYFDLLTLFVVWTIKPHGYNTEVLPRAVDSSFFTAAGVVEIASPAPPCSKSVDLLSRVKVLITLRRVFGSRDVSDRGLRKTSRWHNCITSSGGGRSKSSSKTEEADVLNNHSRPKQCDVGIILPCRENAISRYAKP